MTHKDIIEFFKSNKEAAEKLGYKKTTISMARVRGVSADIQIRAHHLSGGALKMDGVAQAHFDFLMAKDCHKAA